MFVPLFAILGWLGLVPVGDVPAARPAEGVQLAQVRIRQHVVIRIPAMPVAQATFSTTAPPPPPIRYIEKKTAKCVPMRDLAAATITRADSVDLLLAGGRRMRAKLGSQCPALDFYNGFYIRPTKDEKLCADRDSIRSRSGGECKIEALRLLVPAR